MSSTSTSSSSGKPGVPLRMSLIMCGVYETLRGERDRVSGSVMMESGPVEGWLEWLVQRLLARQVGEL